ncbi:T9SS type A sorting domain-containing protein, partial [Rhodothermus profundi]
AVGLRLLEVAPYLVAAEDEGAVPERFALYEAYPNPFRRQATIRFAVPRQVRVRLEVYDVLGRRVGVLVDEKLAPGLYAVRFEAQGLASGLYFYRLTAGSFVQQRKIILVK